MPTSRSSASNSTPSPSQRIRPGRSWTPWSFAEDLIEPIWHGEHRWEQGSLTITYPSVLQDIAAMRRNPAAHPASIPDHDRDELLHPRPLPEPVKEE